MTELSLSLAGKLPAEVAIVGGSGKIARILTELLVADGVDVRSIVRSEKHAEGLRALGATPVLCDIEATHADELANAFGDAEAVVFAAGAGPGSGAARKLTVDLEGSKKSADAALLSGAMRFVQISFIGAQEPTPEIEDAVFAAYWDAKREADEYLRSVALDWTIVKPGGLTDDPATGRGEVTFAEMDRGVKTRRADVAELIRLTLADQRTVWRDLSVAEGDTPLDEAITAAVQAAPQSH
ncbi:NAD(P)H-binding protein [Gulosibacter chungangensis]|uniref:NAD(P)H-binding protein n=1 Tax=Gulosibacter chungangensis TaxID=979746 RepID=A0A7J5BER6_9MICO|nr:NAD(P)H-binding protein [Gulosibacter chungangensis]KAB1644144.1 NAD(P)H-binding protein [Gulosibacter chungangensis]